MTTTAHPFSADRPITSRVADQLGRSGFAESLASAIRGWKGNDSLVIALYGSWGSGKSSVKNLTLESLRESKGDCPQIVEFNPWQWAGQAQLAEAFFHEIGLALGKSDKSKCAKKRATKWRAYGASLKVCSFFTGSIPKAISGLLIIIALIGLGNSFNAHLRARLTLAIISSIALLLAALFTWGGTFAERVAIAFEAFSLAHCQSLAELKLELEGLLKDLDNSILVVIDDVDRLSLDEIKLLFQLIKANADFPNLIYLLLFQRDIVENSLEAAAPTTGREFLKKIVQVGFDLPRIERIRFEKVLSDGLAALLEGTEAMQLFDRQRWGNIFIPGLRHYFKTLRDVHRFLATLSFHVSLFHSKGSFEVNPVDLIALEVLRLFEPEVYHHIPEVKSALTVQYDSSYRHGDEKKMRRMVESIVEQSIENNCPQVREILKQLFPPAAWIFGGVNYGPGFGEQWVRDLRVCHPDIFDRYFHFNIPEGDISQADINRVLSLTDNRKGLVNEFHVLNERGILGVVLDRLEAYKEKIDLQHAVPFITSLFDIGDEFPERLVGSFEIGAGHYIHRIISWYLIQEKDSAKRGLILKKATKDTTGLYMPIMVTSIEDNKGMREKEPDSFIATENDLQELQKICVEKIINASKSGALKTNPQMEDILYRWREWTSPEEPKKWVEELIKTKEGLLFFLTAFLSRGTSHGEGDYVLRIHWHINLENLEYFAKAEVLAEKISCLDFEDLEDREQKAVRAFQNAMKKRKEGKPDDDWRYDEIE